MKPETVALIKKMIEFIKSYQVEFETSPSQAEIARAINRSSGGIPGLLKKAEARGLLRHKYGKPREIEVLQ